MEIDHTHTHTKKNPSDLHKTSARSLLFYKNKKQKNNNKKLLKRTIKDFRPVTGQSWRKLKRSNKI